MYIKFLQNKLESAEIAFVSLLSRYKTLKEKHLEMDELETSEEPKIYAFSKRQLH